MAESDRILVKRSDKKAFWGVGTGAITSYTRMRGFTSLSGSKNPKEYSRQYVDEDFEQSDVTGYSPSWAFGFDQYVGDTVLEDIVSIIDGEKTGIDAVRDIVFVDFSKATTNAYNAVKRSFAVIADTEGDGTDAYTYSGSLKVKSESTVGTVTLASGETPESVQSVTFVPTES